jgi:hypothetical protein
MPPSNESPTEFESLPAHSFDLTFLGFYVKRTSAWSATSRL